MTDTKNEAPERVWIAGLLDECGHYYSNATEAEGEHGGAAAEYVRADMIRQRDEARAEGFAAGLEAAAKVANSLLVRSLVRSRFGTEVVYSDCVAAAIGDLAEGAKP